MLRYVISAALLLVLNAASALVPAAATVPGATVAACFAPEENCAALAVGAIDRARRQILVTAYNLTTGSGIVEALVRARERGVDVRLIADKRTPCERNPGIEVLVQAGTPIWIDHQVPIAHAKTMVIDGALTLMGSYNWTRNAARNFEDLNLVASRRLAATYAEEWRTRLAVAVPFE